MPEILLEAKKREISGKAVKKLRKQGIMPAILYGHGINPVPVQVPREQFLKIFRKAGENTIFKLVIRDEKLEDVRDVLIHDVEFDPLDGLPIHADFYQVRLDEKVTVSVPLVFIGESPAVKNEGGILVKALQELEIEALPKDIPEEIKVDISKLLTFEDAIYVKDLDIPSGVKVLVLPDVVVALVQPPRSEEELKALEEAPVASPEVITEREAKKKEEEALAEKEG